MKPFYKYLPLSETEENWGFYVTTVGYTKIIPQGIYPPSQGHPSSHAFTWNKGRILDGYYLVFITRGKGVFESAQTSPVMVGEGACFFLFPNVWHRYKPDASSGWEEFWVGFKGRYPDSIMKQNFFNSQTPFLDAGLNEQLLILFSRLLETVRNAVPGYHQIISGITLEILGLVYAISVHKEQGEDPTQQLIAKAMFLLRESLDKPVDIELLAKGLPMGYSKFRTAFKKISGQSPHEYHLTLRVEKARELLRSTSLKINEIAYQTGFDSEYYFSKFFKKKVGISPKFYRKSSDSDFRGEGRL
jgi:AraC-like DNA-binding protein